VKGAAFYFLVEVGRQHHCLEFGQLRWGGLDRLLPQKNSEAEKVQLRGSSPMTNSGSSNSKSFIQLLTKWHPVRLDEYILLPIDYGFVNRKDCFFVSHYWHTREHPDPTGHDVSLSNGPCTSGMVLHLGKLDILAAGSAERIAADLLSENAAVYSYACTRLRL
jgi:hypothetical protein